MKLPKLKDHYGLSGFGVSLCFIGVIVGFIVLCFCIVVPVETASCHQAARRVGGVTGHYKTLTGCYYKLPSGREIPQENYPPKYIHISR